jgi:hypothetical protein
MSREMYKTVRVSSAAHGAKRFWRVILRYLSFVALAILLLLACWFTGNVVFTHPADAFHHVETLADLQCTLDSMIFALSSFCLLGGGLAAWWCLLFGQHRNEDGARRYFCGWHSSSYKQIFRSLGFFVSPGLYMPRAILLGR